MPTVFYIETSIFQKKTRYAFKIQSQLDTMAQKAYIVREKEEKYDAFSGTPPRVIVLLINKWIDEKSKRLYDSMKI